MRPRQEMHRRGIGAQTYRWGCAIACAREDKKPPDCFRPGDKRDIELCTRRLGIFYVAAVLILLVTGPQDVSLQVSFPFRQQQTL